MGIRQLKKENPELNKSMLDHIQSLDTSKNKKITPLLVRFIKSRISDNELNNYFSDLLVY